jgi:hypothetical protein
MSQLIENTENEEQLLVTLTGKNTLDIVKHLCEVTGMTPSCLVALMVRKYGKDLEQWLGEPTGLSLSKGEGKGNEPINKPLELPHDPGEHLTPIEL